MATDEGVTIDKDFAPEQLDVLMGFGRRMRDSDLNDEEMGIAVQRCMVELIETRGERWEYVEKQLKRIAEHATDDVAQLSAVIELGGLYGLRRQYR